MRVVWLLGQEDRKRGHSNPNSPGIGKCQSDRIQVIGEKLLIGQLTPCWVTWNIWHFATSPTHLLVPLPLWLADQALLLNRTGTTASLLFLSLHLLMRTQKKMLRNQATAHLQTYRQRIIIIDQQCHWDAFGMFLYDIIVEPFACSISALQGILCTNTKIFPN